MRCGVGGKDVVRCRPYRVEHTGYLLTSEGKRRRARLVLGWGTLWEDRGVLSAFAFGLAQLELALGLRICANWIHFCARARSPIKRLANAGIANVWVCGDRCACLGWILEKEPQEDAPCNLHTRVLAAWARTKVWPSGLRRWLQAPVRKGVGSNPTAVMLDLFSHNFCRIRASPSFYDPVSLRHERYPSVQRDRFPDSACPPLMHMGT